MLKKLRIAKKGTAYGEKPPAVKTHLRNMVIVPEMIGSIVGVYNGKAFINAEIKPEMIGILLLFIYNLYLFIAIFSYCN